MKINKKFIVNRYVLGASLVILLVLGILAFSFYAEKIGVTKPSPSPSPSLEASPTPIPTPEKAVEFKLQLGVQSAGRVINTDYLSATEGGWFLVYDDKEGAVGNLIEAAIPPFDPGVQRGAVFILSQPLKAGSYWAVLSKEKNQGEFIRQKFSVR